MGSLITWHSHQPRRGCCGCHLTGICSCKADGGATACVLKPTNCPPNSHAVLPCKSSPWLGDNPWLCCFTAHFDTCRQECELPCDMQQDCNTLCECWGFCGGNSYCTCGACETLAPDAASDSQFFTIQSAAASSGAASASIIAGELQGPCYPLDWSRSAQRAVGHV